MMSITEVSLTEQAAAVFVVFAAGPVPVAGVVRQSARHPFAAWHLDECF